VDEIPEEGFTPRLADSYWSTGAAIMVCHDEMTKDWPGGCKKGNGGSMRTGRNQNGVSLVFSIDAVSVTVLEGLRWKPSAAWDKPSSPFWALSQKGGNKKTRRGGRRGGGEDRSSYGEYHFFHSG